MSPTPAVPLAGGATIPQVGFGVFQIPAEETVPAVTAALEHGYRHIDTAALYRNEQQVGEAVRQSGLPREDVFLTTKLWHDRHARDAALRAFEESRARLGVDVVDLYLIHWPAPQQGRYVEAWRALLELRDQGAVRTVGVSNFEPEHLRRLIEETGETPALNQIELHPYLQQRALREFHAEYGIVTEAWSPLAKGRALLADPVVTTIAERHGRTPAQVVLRWHVQQGIVVIPKSVTPARIAENLEVDGFELAPEDLDALARLDTPDGRTGPDPARFG